MNRYLNYLILILIVIYGSGYAATLSVKEISYQEYELKLQHDQPLEIAQAQAAMHQSAIQLCNGKNPVFGIYDFKSTEPVTNEKAKATFTFTQRITCSNEAYVAPVRDKFNLTKQQENTLKDIARDYTNDYLSAKNKGKYKEAYGMLTPGMKGTTSYGDWKFQEDKFQAVTGNFIKRDIWRITVYDNPESSAQPGIYIAADYESEYENVPVHCGYVIWFINKPESTKFRVMREEHGHVGNNVFNQISENDLSAIKSKFGCNPN